LALLLAASAHAQTYDVEITMAGIAPAPVTFSGSFTFDTQGTCQGSAAFCPVGSKPMLSNVTISDPLSMDQPSGPRAFTGGLGSAYGVELMDTYYGVQGQSSSNTYLWFTTPKLLGSETPQMTDITFWGGGPTGQSCGVTPGVTCTTASLRVATAAEIDSTSAISDLTLLLGGLAVLRGRRSVL